MSSTGYSPFLRRALLVDAAISAATGLAMILGAGVLHGLLGLPVALLRYAGLSLIPFVALVFHLSRRDSLSRAGVWTVIGLNAVWVAGSVLLLLSGRFEPNALGFAFVLGQAAAVAVFAEMQYVGLRKSTMSAA